MFGIRIATYRRPNGTSHLLHRCLRSIIQQTYTNWKVFIVGDCYEPEDELFEICSIIPKNKINIINLPISPERNKYSGDQLWSCAGFTACQTGLLQIQKEGLIHVPIDDDDYWLPEHLNLLADAYLNFPEAAFIYTQSTYRDSILPKETPELFYDNLPPKAYNVIHSAVSWDTKRIPVMYANIMEEKSSFVAGDAETWERIRNYCTENNLKTLYIPKLTVRHDYERAEHPIMPLLL